MGGDRSARRQRVGHVGRLAPEKNLAFLARAVVHFVRAGFAVGEAAVIIATPAHIALFGEHLPGFSEALDRRQLVVLDADECLQTFMVDGMPDRQAFVSTVSTVLQAAWAQLLCTLTGQHDVAFGTAVSGRPAEVVGADSMVGLMINTVPVRANITPATTTADLLDQLQSAHNDTVEHQHLALSEIHRITGHERLFDTLFVYQNYPIDTAALKQPA